MSDEKLGEAQGRAERLVSAAKTSYRDKRGNGPRKDTQISLEAAIFAARGSLEDKPRIQESSRDRAARVANERRSLLDWADERNCRGSPAEIPRADDRGAEHIVQLKWKQNRVLKMTRESWYGAGFAYGEHTIGATPSEYLERIRLHNEIFGDDVRLEKFIPLVTHLGIVTSQPLLNEGTPATPSEVESFMFALGFEHLGRGLYHRNKILVHDLQPRNVKTLNDGTLLVFDPLIQRIDSLFLNYLRQLGKSAT